MGADLFFMQETQHRNTVRGRIRKFGKRTNLYVCTHHASLIYFLCILIYLIVVSLISQMPANGWGFFFLFLFFLTVMYLCNSFNTGLIFCIFWMWFDERIWWWIIGLSFFYATYLKNKRRTQAIFLFIYLCVYSPCFGGYICNLVVFVL